MNHQYFLQPLVLLCLIVVLGGLSNTVQASELQLIAYSNSYSNALPLKELIEDEWESAPNRDSDLAYSTNTFGIQYQTQNWFFSLGKRVDLIANASPDSVLALYQDKVDQAFFTDKAYQLDLKLKQIQAQFVSLGYQYQASNWQLLPVLSYFQLEKMRDSQLQGSVEVNPNGDFLGRVTFDEHYTEHNLLKRPYDNWQRDGKGLSFTLKFNYQWQQLDLSVNAYDLLSRLEINNSGYSSGTLDTNNNYRPELGLNSIGPLFSGVETESDANLKLNTRYELKLNYKLQTLSQAGLTADVERFAGHHRLWLGGYKQLQQLKFGFAVDALNSVAQVGLESAYFKLNLALDNIDVEQAKQFKLAAALAYQW